MKKQRTKATEWKEEHNKEPQEMTLFLSSFSLFFLSFHSSISCILADTLSDPVSIDWKCLVGKETLTRRNKILSFTLSFSLSERKKEERVAPFFKLKTEKRVDREQKNNQVTRPTEKGERRNKRQRKKGKEGKRKEKGRKRREKENGKKIPVTRTGKQESGKVFLTINQFHSLPHSLSLPLFLSPLSLSPSLSLPLPRLIQS